MYELSKEDWEKFWDNVDVRDDDCCWLWKLGTNNYGYGRFYYRNKNGEKARALVHRLAYQYKHGEISKGAIICHSCDAPPCCNPDHLWEGNDHENQMDSIQKGRSRGIGIRCKETGEEFPSMRQAAYKFDISYRSLRSVLDDPEYHLILLNGDKVSFERI